MSDYFCSLKKAKCNKVIVCHTLFMSHLCNLRIQISTDIIHTCMNYPWSAAYIQTVLCAPPLHNEHMNNITLGGVRSVQPADIGWPTGNRKKLSCCQAQLSQATCLAVAYLFSISCRPSYVRRLYLTAFFRSQI